MRRHAQRGSAIAEMAIIFIPLVFLLLSTFELGRAMWVYHSLTSSLKSGARFAVVRQGPRLGSPLLLRTQLGARYIHLQDLMDAQPGWAADLERSLSGAGDS